MQNTYGDIYGNNDNNTVSSQAKTPEKPKIKNNTTRIIGIIIGILLICVSLPVIIFNLFFIVQGLLVPDKAPNLNGQTPLIVLTESMYPTIEGGDLIIVNSVDPQKLKKDDVAAYFDPAAGDSAIVTHRIVDVTSENGLVKYKTKGDANNTEDKNLVSERDIVGKYNGMRIPKVGNLCMWIRSVPGIIVCIGIPLILLVGYDVIRRRVYAKKQAQTEDELRAELERLKRQQGL